MIGPIISSCIGVFGWSVMVVCAMTLYQKNAAAHDATTRARALKTTNTERFIIIGDRKYDITHFNHPGGNVISYMIAGQDATEAYREFHYRSKRADAVLKILHSELVARSIDDRVILDSFAIFRARLVSEGFFEPDIPMVCYRVIEQAVLFAMAVYVSRFSWIVGACLMGMFRVRSGWIQHEGGHNSLTGVMWVDKMIQEFFAGFGLYSCGAMWNKMHNRHHATPQKMRIRYGFRYNAYNCVS